MANWTDWLFSKPLRPVNGDPINPAYRQMPDATAPIEDVRSQGAGAWMSRPHDQNIQSRNLAGYYQVPSLDSITWQQGHGWDRDPPRTPLADPDFIPTDPSIVARIKQKAWDADTWESPDQPGLQISPQQLQNIQQYAGWGQ